VALDFFPLDEELELVPGSLTPQAYESLVRLGARLPSFDQAVQELALTLKVEMSEATGRRWTEAAGAAYEVVQAQEVERLEREVPLAVKGAAKVQVSADGTMVPLVGGDWAEVKTVAIGEIKEVVRADGRREVRTEQISYFSRRVEAEQFNRLALGEMHRRGVEQADVVAAPADGAEWIQNFLEFHCPEAIRILDFPHAAERISAVGQVSLAPDQVQPWFKQQLHQLKHEGPTKVLLELQQLQSQQPDLALIAENLAYLQKREAHMQYPTFQAQGLPIGSGSVESGHKVVIAPRLKGAGMRWAPQHVNPMVALRNLVCNNRWQEDWPKIAAQLRQQQSQRRRTLKQQRRAQKTSPHGPTASIIQPAAKPTPVVPKQPPHAAAEPKNSAPYRPAANHPWRRSPIGRARYQPHNHFSKN
jgi:hypothetical protein